MSETLKKLQNLVNELSQTNSTLEKKEILKRYAECREILYYIYNPFIKFYITSASLMKRKDLVDRNYNRSIYVLLDELKDRNETGHEAISIVNGFIENNKDYEDLIYRIIDKNLKVKIDAKIINSIWENTIPEFSVQLANKYEKEINFEKEVWFASHKLDGVRLLTIIKDGEITFWSRTGNQFFTLDNLHPSIYESFKDYNNVVIDGEVAIVENYVENFQGTMKEITRKNHTIENPRYYIFDFLSLRDFERKYSEITFSERLKRLPKVVGNLQILKQVKIKNEGMFQELKQEAQEKNWEGLIIRKDVPYEGKRTKNLLKVKSFYDDEYIVKSIYLTKKRMLDDKGLEKEIDCMGGVVIEHKGYEVGVGSGWSDNERIYYKNHPDKIIGKTITVKYFEETTDQNGNLSLRFPIFKNIYEGERDI